MTFALITEGVSEYRIIRYILLKYFKEQEEPEINPVQPKIINNKQEGAGGWNQVLSYCSNGEKLKAALIENDYLVIQIDTDQSQTKPFDVSHTNTGNKEKTAEELHLDVVTKLISLIPPEVFAALGQRIFFAVCVHTIECWLLPIYYTNHHRSDTRNCISTLNKELGKQKLDTLAPGNKNNPVSIRAYDTILKSWRRKSDIITAAKHNTGFEKFTDALAAIPV